MLVVELIRLACTGQRPLLLPNKRLHPTGLSWRVSRWPLGGGSSVMAFRLD